MFKQLATLFAAAAVTVSAAALQAREDVTIIVDIPASYNGDVTSFCTAWGNQCTTDAESTGTPYYVCDQGYDGANTARVDCLAVTGATTAVNFTDEVASDLGAALVP